MTKRVLIGVLTPSSNTRLEPIFTEMLSGIEEASAHFSRFRVVEISMNPEAARQFDHEPIVGAAQLLADAHVDVIVWTGTAGGWRGLAADRQLCREITDRTGIPATTSTLALMEVLHRTGVVELALVTPCPDDMQNKIEENFASEGVAVITSRNLSVTENWTLAELGADTFDELIDEVAAAQPQAISTYCTNFNTAHLVPEWERRHGIPVYDSISVAVWQALLLAGVDPGRLAQWGRLFHSTVPS